VSRQDSRERIERRIVELGRRHLVTDGAAGLSLRAIARDLGMVSSAVYRYVASRDELLTLLLVDAYTDLADGVDAAVRAAGTDWRAQLTALAHAARSWAVAQPASWALLYGSPVPGYHAPHDRTGGPGTRVIATLIEVVAVAEAAGEVPDAAEPAPAPLSSDLAALRAEFGTAIGDGAFLRCVTLWSALVGAISLEVFVGYGADTLTDPGQVFDLQLRLLTAVVTQ
jgi:AcrR family transcriptional regulator